jgi:hypothetical protein
MYKAIVIDQLRNGDVFDDYCFNQTSKNNSKIEYIMSDFSVGGMFSNSSATDAVTLD